MLSRFREKFKKFRDLFAYLVLTGTFCFFVYGLYSSLMEDTVSLFGSFESFNIFLDQHMDIFVLLGMWSIWAFVFIIAIYYFVRLLIEFVLSLCFGGLRQKVGSQ